MQEKSGMYAPTEIKEHFSFSQVGIVFVVAVMLIGVSWMKNPALFDVFKKQQVDSTIVANLPRYYAYEAPAELSQPLIAGASTENAGPMIINEDGSVTPAVERGDVLGVSTENITLDLDAIKVNVISDSDDGIRSYISTMQTLEGGYMDSIQFEAALSSGDQNQIDGQVRAVRSVISGLQSLSVPASLVQLHKLKVLQYQAAMEILRNFTQADDNPELINRNLEIFLKAEEQIQEEVIKIKNKYNALFAL